MNIQQDVFEIAGIFFRSELYHTIRTKTLIPEPTARSAVQGVNPGRRQGY